MFYDRYMIPIENETFGLNNLFSPSCICDIIIHEIREIVRRDHTLYLAVITLNQVLESLQ